MAEPLIEFAIERMGDERLMEVLRSVASAIGQTNDPATLRKLGQSLKLLGDYARSEAFTVTKEHW